MPKKTPIIFETARETYTSRELRGEGRNGRVFEVVDSDGAVWALKCLKPDSLSREKTKRFLNELTFCQKCSHENIISIIDHGFVLLDEKKCPFYVMPLYSSTLRDLLEAGIAHRLALQLFAQILDGIEAAHLQGVWHRDLKPENILHDQSTGRLIVSDFGVAHFAEEVIHTTVETGPGDRLGNFLYSAPEQRFKGSHVDQRADIFALGLILNELFTGQVLQGTGFKRISDVAPPYAYLDLLIDRMVRSATTERPASIAEVKAYLIAARNEFVSRQKLDELRKVVVPANRPTDPIVSDPIRVTAFDVEGDVFVISLNRSVTPTWVRAFKTIASFSYMAGSAPANWNFSGDKASVQLSARVLQNHAQRVVDNFKDYVEKANTQYRKEVDEAARAAEESARQALQRQRDQEQRRQHVLKSVKI